MSERYYVALARQAASRLRTHGVLWLVRRAAITLHSPSTPARGLIPGALLRLIAGRPRRNGGDPVESAADTLLAFYDLSADPPAFDVLFFLLAAESRRRLLGLHALHIVFVGVDPRIGPQDNEALGLTGHGATTRRIHNLLVPSAWCLPSVRSVEVVQDRREATARLASWRRAHVFPEAYAEDLHRGFIFDYYRHVLQRPVPEGVTGAFRADKSALAYVERWLAARGRTARVVSITVRDNDFHPARNSNLSAWAQFARYLQQRGYLPVFIPDTDSLAEGLSAEICEFPHLSEAAWNLGLRMALYERAFVNLSVNTGPAFLYLMNERARGIVFKLTTPGVREAETQYLLNLGYEIGGQIPFCTPFQKFVWEQDELAIIIREFEDMEHRLIASEHAVADMERVVRERCG
jgi:hypothetical protein